jgi:hypothetical protein
MDITFEIAPEGVDGDKDAWSYPLFISDALDTAGSNFTNLIE